MKRLTLGLTLSLMLLAGPAAAGEARAGIVLNYQETEPGTEPYPVRMLVTDDYLRIDDGVDSGDYILLDRERRTLFSVTHARRNILVIPYTEFDSSAKTDTYRAVVSEDPRAPRIADTPVKRVALVAGEDVCMTASVVPGLLPAAVVALQEYQNVLASRQHRDIDLMPESMRTPCFYVNYIYGNARHLETGLPIQLDIKDGRKRMLMDYQRDVMLPVGLFELPAEYERVKME